MCALERTVSFLDGRLLALFSPKNIAEIALSHPGSILYPLARPVTQIYNRSLAPLFATTRLDHSTAYTPTVDASSSMSIFFHKLLLPLFMGP